MGGVSGCCCKDGVKYLMKNSSAPSKPDSQPVSHPQSNNFQPCLQCGSPIGVIAGSKEAICGNCGYKDPCCE